MSSPDSGTYYDILGISLNSTQDEIKKAYRERAKQSHPDINGKGSNDEFLQIKEAFEVLSDPVKRSSYNWVIEEYSNENSKNKNSKRSSFTQPNGVNLHNVNNVNSSSASAASGSGFGGAGSASSTASGSSFSSSIHFRKQLRNKFPRSEKERVEKIKCRRVPLKGSGNMRILGLPVFLIGAWAYYGYQSS